MREVRITVDGQEALTVEQAALRYGLTRSSMRSALARLGDAIHPAAPLDERKQLYLVADLDRVMAERPGRGANLRTR